MNFTAKINAKRERISRLEEAFMVGFGTVVGFAIVMVFMAVMM